MSNTSRDERMCGRAGRSSMASIRAKASMTSLQRGRRALRRPRGLETVMSRPTDAHCDSGHCADPVGLALQILAGSGRCGDVLSTTAVRHSALRLERTLMTVPRKKEAVALDLLRSGAEQI